MVNVAGDMYVDSSSQHVHCVYIHATQEPGCCKIQLEAQTRSALGPKESNREELSSIHAQPKIELKNWIVTKS